MTTEAATIAALLEAGKTAEAVTTATAHLEAHRARWEARKPWDRGYYTHLAIQGARKRLAEATAAHDAAKTAADPFAPAPSIHSAVASILQDGRPVPVDAAA